MTEPTFPTVANSWSVTKAPKFATRIQKAISGREIRVLDQLYPIWTWTLTYEVIRDKWDTRQSGGGSLGATFDELRTLAGFFLQMQGAFGSFLYTDPTDNTITGQAIGTGDGKTTQFQLVRTFGGFNEPITAPNVVSHVYVEGVDPGGWSVDHSTGIITFTGTPPAPGTHITTDFNYRFRVRFTDDTADFENFLYQLWALKQIKFQSIVDVAPPIAAASVIDGLVLLSSQSVNPRTATLTTTLAGDLIVVAVGLNGTGAAISSITSSPTGLTFTRRKQELVGSGGGSLEYWTAPATTALNGEVITITYSGAFGFNTGLVFGVSGVSNVNAPFDTNASLPVFANGSTSIPFVTGLSTDNINYDLLLFFCHDGNDFAGNDYRTPLGFTEIGHVDQLGNGASIFGAYRTITPNQTNLSISMLGVWNAAWAAIGDALIVNGL